MTDVQKIQIREHRAKGVGYTTISHLTGIPVNTVKSFCKRNDLGRHMSEATEVNPVEESNPNQCKKCGDPLVHTPGRKQKKFCSDTCRMNWWKVHPGLVKQKAFYRFTCASCGKGFTAYGNKKRKFCSHGCYITGRFGKFRKAGKKVAA